MHASISQLQSAPSSPPQLVPTPKGDLLVPAAPDPSLGAPVKFSLIIPTYNESKNIEPLLTRLQELLEEPLAGSYELLVVDDDSPDRTWEVALKVAETLPNVRVMRRQGEKGLSTAVIRGWQAARGEILGVMDADLQHPPEVNLGLLAEIQKGADLATGSRHVEGGGVSDWSMFRRMMSRGAQLLGLIILPGVLSRLSDPMSGYFMVKRATLSSARLDPVGYKILVEVVGRCDPKWIGEVGYVFRERVEGESKVTWKLYVHYLQHLLRLRIATLHKSRFLRFCVVGASGVIVDMSLLYLLSDPSTLGLGLTRSKIMAAEAAILSNFLLNDAWTFRDLASKATGAGSKLRRFIGFNAICALGVAINVLILNLLFNYLHMDRYIANAIAILIVTGWNYLLNRHLNWAPLKTSAG
jgi:dolichol-phosphate mannosyltransferase